MGADGITKRGRGVTDSIMQDEKYCYITGTTRDLERHHCFTGIRRKAADQWGCWVWLTHDVHMSAHQRQPEILDQLRRECQEAFESRYGHEKFMEVFGKNYL